MSSMSSMSGMGTGQVEYTEGRTIIHFGSAEGSTYEDPEVKTWRNMSVLDWVNETRHG